MRLNPALFLHPEDKSLQKQLNTSVLFRFLLKMCETLILPEQQFVAVLSANGFRVSEKVFPDLYCTLTDICRKLEVPVPELYVWSRVSTSFYAVYPEHSYVVLSPNLLFLRPAYALKADLAASCAKIALNPYGNWLIMADVVSFLAGKMKKLVLKLLTIILDRSLRHAIYASCLSADRIAMMCFEGDKELVETCFASAGNWQSEPVPEENLAFREETALYHQLYEKYVDNSGPVQIKLDKMGLIDIAQPGPKKRASEAILWADTEEFRKLNLCMNHPEQAQEWPIPFDCQTTEGKSPESVRDILSRGGFTNITTEVSWRKDPKIPDGSVASMAVNGSTSYQQGEWFPADVPIVLTIQQRPSNPETN